MQRGCLEPCRICAGSSLWTAAGLRSDVRPDAAPTAAVQLSSGSGRAASPGLRPAAGVSRPTVGPIWTASSAAGLSSAVLSATAAVSTAAAATTTVSTGSVLSGTDGTNPSTGLCSAGASDSSINGLTELWPSIHHFLRGGSSRGVLGSKKQSPLDSSDCVSPRSASQVPSSGCVWPPGWFPNARSNLPRPLSPALDESARTVEGNVPSAVLVIEGQGPHRCSRTPECWSQRGTANNMPPA